MFSEGLFCRYGYYIIESPGLSAGGVLYYLELFGSG